MMFGACFAIRPRPGAAISQSALEEFLRARRLEDIELGNHFLMAALLEEQIVLLLFEFCALPRLRLVLLLLLDDRAEGHFLGNVRLLDGSLGLR